MTAAKIQEPLNGSFHDDDNSQDILSLHPSDNHLNDGEGEDYPSIEEEISCRKAESLALRSTADRTDINNLFCAHPSVDINQQQQNTADLNLDTEILDQIISERKAPVSYGPPISEKLAQVAVRYWEQD